MDVRYRIKQGRKWSKPLRLGKFRSRLHDRGGPYLVREQTQKKWRKRFTASKAAKLIAHAYEPGALLIVKPGTGRALQVRVVAEKPRWRKVKLPPGSEDWHPLIKQVWQFVHHTFPEAEDWGTCNCRPTRHDPSIYSQHSRWKDGCRATDIGVSSLTLGDRIAAAVHKQFGDKVGIVWRTTAHYDHLHLEVRPIKRGTPVCAGGNA